MATRSAPIVIQAVLAVLLIATWLLGRRPALGGHDPSSALLVATVITVVISLVAAVVLWRRPSTSARGVGLSIAASAAITLIGAVTYAFWLL